MRSVTALSLLLLAITPTFTEVVTSMSECNTFLLNRTPPHVPSVLENGKILNQNRYKPICQTYRNKRRFVTLYDAGNKIPVFSAYKYVGEEEKKRPKKHWKVEPQLESENADQNMKARNKQLTYNHQAIETDFRSNGTFDRGHVFPSAHAFTKVDKISTFTLTNIVPQAGTFNKGSWNKMENCVKCIMEKHCVNGSGVTEGFVVTGAQPSSNQYLNNRINVPSLLWSAFCCYSASMETWIASAHWGRNVPDESRNKHLETRTLAELHDKLRHFNSEFKVFPGAQCPLYTTVTQFYPQSQQCHCPPTISSIPDPPTLTSGSSTPRSTSQSSTSATPSSSYDPNPSTSAPPSSSYDLNPSTSAPPSSSYDPNPSTSAPPSSSYDPNPSTSAHPSSSYDPNHSTSAPPSSSYDPNPSTSAPPSSSYDLNPSTSAPPSSSFDPNPLTSAPPSSSFDPNPSTSAPPSSSYDPNPSTSAHPSSSYDPNH